MFKDKILLITGGTGSFGNAALERFLKTDIGEIRIFSRDEKKQFEMRRIYKDDRIKYYIGDVRDISSIKNAIFNVDYVFHAAALKQVPSCELFPLEAVKTNILGVDNVLTAAIEAGVKKVICLSSDKAVYPVNAMGASKALMEKVLVAKARTVSPSRTLICATRFGNMLCTRGSVIPLFVQQIKEGKSLTVTEPTMTRFIMSLKSITWYCLPLRMRKRAISWAQKAHACTVETMVKALKKIFDADNEVKIIGLDTAKDVRDLAHQGEVRPCRGYGRILQDPMDKRDLNYANSHQRRVMTTSSSIPTIPSS